MYIIRYLLTYSQGLQCDQRDFANIEPSLRITERMYLDLPEIYSLSWMNNLSIFILFTSPFVF